MELFCHRTGKEKKDAEKIVLLHGMGGTGTVWRPVAASLEDHYDLLAPDQRGHGKSRVPATAATERHANFSPLKYGNDLIETLARHSFYPAVLVGHSMGVRTACAAATLKPEWVRGLVLIDLGFSSDPGSAASNALLHFLGRLPTEFETRQTARDYLYKHAPDQAVAQFLLAVSTRLQNGSPTRFPFDKNALIQTIHAAKGAPLRSWLTKTASKKIPVLVLRGSHSHVYERHAFREDKKYFLKYPSILFEEIQDAGHGLPFEKRSEFVARLKKFLEGIGRK